MPNEYLLHKIVFSMIVSTRIISSARIILLPIVQSEKLFGKQYLYENFKMIEGRSAQ